MSDSLKYIWLCALLPGCVVMSPSPAVEALNLLSAAGTSAVSMMATTPQNVITRPHDTVRLICIEFNRSTEVPDLVPAIQLELRRLEIDSRLYAAGTVPTDCPMTLNYSASMQWGQHGFFNSEYQAYMTTAELILRSNGKVVSSASYRPGVMSMDKWQSTSYKIAPVVQALLKVDKK